MSLVVEDGTGLSNAESYISVSDTTAYHAARGNTAWAAIATDTLREQYLRQATDYMVAKYTSRWQGYKVYPESQALDWPRYGLVVDYVEIAYNIVPYAVKKACAELALRAASSELAPDLSQAAVSEQVGSIAVTYNANSPQATRYQLVDMILAPFLVCAVDSPFLRIERV